MLASVQSSLCYRLYRNAEIELRNCICIFLLFVCSSVRHTELRIYCSLNLFERSASREIFETKRENEKGQRKFRAYGQLKIENI